MVLLGNERLAVQNPLLRYAEQAGWTYLPRDEALRLRRGETGLVLHQVLVEQLQRLNPGVVDLARAEEIVRRLSRVPPTVEGNLDAWEYLRGLKTVFVDADKQERNVHLLDPANGSANTFHVTEELTFTNGTYRIRPDLVFLLNGIPVIVVEAKAATRAEGIGEALDQLRRYHREGPELMALLQLFGLTHVVQFYYGATWNLSRKTLFNWRDEAGEQASRPHAGDFETLVKSFFHPLRVLRTLTDFILFTRTDGELSKVVLRPHQMRAVERVAQRARDPEKRRALVWHTQGSGKTYTMITVAKQLIEDPAFENPTVLMLVDRNELEEQLFGNLESVGFGRVNVADSKADLRRLLHEDHRGLIVSTIHKFDDMPARMSERENFFVLVDEAHRTTGGNLGNYLVGALPNATYVGFTGTPIDRTAHGKGTFKVFGADDPKGYLDKYSIRESIQDGTTVPLHYALAPNELQVDRATLEKEFLDLADLEGVADVETLNRVLDRVVNLRNMLKNPDRLERVAAHVARHFRENVEPMGYKAFLVGVDRGACALYKEALDRYLPPEYSEVVISHAHNDPPELARFHYGEDREEDIRKAFRKPDKLPKILIVTEKLLTGFDAPILYAMYLDKPLRDHVLLQAIARVNRPYEDAEGRRKPSGFVLDSVGIFDKLEKALAFDSRDIQGVIDGIEVLQKRFATLMAQGRADYLSLLSGLSADKAVEAVLDHFRDRERRDLFYRYFEELEEAYEILSPDPFLRPLIADYDELSRMYKLVRGSFDPSLDVEKSFLRKTAELVQEHTSGSAIRESRAVYELNENSLEAIAHSERPDTVKVFNLIKALHELVAEKGLQQPFLIPIGERAERIAEAFSDRQTHTQGALQDLLSLVDEVQEAQRRWSESGMSTEAFAVFWYLRGRESAGAETVAGEMAGAFTSYPHWRTTPEQERKVRMALHKALYTAGIKTGTTDMVDDILTNLKRTQP